VLKAKSIQFDNLNHNCCGRILVYLRGKKDLYYGEELILRGSLNRPFAAGDSARQNFRNYLHNQDIWLIMRVRTDADIVRRNKNNVVMLRLVLGLKNKMEGVIARRTSIITSGILNAMVLGEKRDVPLFISNAMMKSGTVHILPRLYTKMPSVAL
jgi:hypothetical protein